MFMRIMLFGIQLFLPMSVVGMAIRALLTELCARDCTSRDIYTVSMF